MKKVNSTNLFLYILVFLIFIIVRTCNITSNSGIYEIEFKTLAISNLSFPFQIIKESAINSYFLPFYYLIIHFIQTLFKNEIAIRIFNSIISLTTIFLLMEISKKILKGKKRLCLGLFLGIFLSVSHFFIYYTNLIAPYCTTLLTYTIIINSIIDYLYKPNRKNLKKLSIANIICILADSLGFLLVASEIIILYLTKKKKDEIIKLLIQSSVAFLIILPILIIQYIRWSKLLIPETYTGVGLNFNSIYLTVNEFLSPYLSFESFNMQNKSTLGMIYSYLLNQNLSEINTLKILTSLLFGSIFPIFTAIFFTFKTFKQNPVLKIVIIIALLNSSFMLIAMLYETIDTSPLYFLALYLTILISTFYGIFKIKDNFIRLIIIFCIIGIQIINPEISSFNITIKKNYPTIGCIKAFIKDYNITSDNFIIMPYLGTYGKYYFKNMSFMDLDYEMLKGKNKKKIIKNIISKKAKTINKNNIHFLMQYYLVEKLPNEYITKLFIENYDKKGNYSNNIILIIDKSNSRPISNAAITKCANNTEYSTSLRKIKFENINIPQNKTKILYDAMKSKTLYNLIDILTDNFYLKEIAQYKKIDNEYYKIDSLQKNIQNALNSMDSDYVFLIFKNL